MANEELPACGCGGRAWQLEGRLHVLFSADSRDPAGPFKSESTLDSVHELLFWCCDCGETAAEETEDELVAIYRSQDPLRAYDPAQGGLLDAFGSDAVVLAPPPLVVRPGASTPG